MRDRIKAWWTAFRARRRLYAARRVCTRHGHAVGPLSVGPQYRVQRKPYFNLLTTCPRCGYRFVIVNLIPYRWKGHRDLHNRMQAVFGTRPPGGTT